MSKSTSLRIVISTLFLATSVLSLALDQNYADETKPEGFYRWNVTLHDTHPSIQYFPSPDNCKWPNPRDCGTGWHESHYGRTTSAGNLPTTFHHTNNFQRQNAEKYGWKLNTRGSHIYVYGAPLPYLPDTPGPAQLCIQKKCHMIDLYDIYTKAPTNDEPVLLAMRDDLDPRYKVDIEFSLVAPVTHNDERKYIKGMTLREVIVTKVDVPHEDTPEKNEEERHREEERRCEEERRVEEKKHREEERRRREREDAFQILVFAVGISSALVLGPVAYFIGRSAGRSAQPSYHSPPSYGSTYR